MLSVENKPILLSVIMFSVVMLNIVAPISRARIMDKLLLTGRNLGRVSKFRIGCVYVVYSCCY